MQLLVFIAAPRVDPNNNNEWRPLGHGDPLQKDPTYDYSPPALDRVRYWAENNGSSSSSTASAQDARQKLPAELLRNKTKNEILLLGVSGERERDRERSRHQQYQQQQQLKQHAHLAAAQQQQAKYAAIRRSYYAPQQQQLQMQQQQQHHMPHTHLMPPPMMTKGMGHVEYRHNVINTPSSSSYMSYSSPVVSSPSPSSSHYYSSSPSSSTSPWFSHSSGMSSLPLSMSPMPLPHRLSSYADTHHQESMQHYSFSRPNSIHTVAAGSATAQRKPWLHELLQKELVKPTMKQRMKPTMPATKYLMGTTRPSTQPPTVTFAPFNYAPVTFVPGPPTVETPTTSKPLEQLYVTPPSSTLTPSLATVQSGLGFQPMYTHTTTTTTAKTTTTTTRRPEASSSSTPSLSNSRLTIPQMNNLSQRPTVAPAPELTTDALFSHYKQPPKPLLGPMYLIIEGHSKVKTYGQNELDPHSPKIVPVISKREPVVRIADPNEKRGTVETYQVKHLHTKTMPLTTTTSMTSTVAPTAATTTTQRSTTTTTRATRATKTTPRSSTTAATPTTTTTAATTATASSNPQPIGGVNDLLSLLDNMFADAHEIVSSTTEASASASSYSHASSSTILRPVTMKTKLMPQVPEPRIGSQAGSIESLLPETDEEVTLGAEIATSTEPEQPPRATRQIFDYDQLPESRIKAKEAADASGDGDAEDELDYEIDDDGVEGAGDDDDEQVLEEEEEDATESLEDSEHNLLKRIDKFVDDVDDGDDDLDDLIEDLSPSTDDDDVDVDVEDEERAAKQHK